MFLKLRTSFSTTLTTQDAADDKPRTTCHGHSMTMAFGKNQTHRFLLETKNKSNSLPETTCVGKIATLYSRKDFRNPQNV
jgi:hypothetical protein